MTELLDDFLVRATLAGIAVAISSGPMGCFVIWRGMAYFGDSIAHAAILGIALSLMLEVSAYLGVFAVALLASLVVTTYGKKLFSTDTILGVYSHSALAFGLIMISLVDGRAVNLEAYLFGEILAVTVDDLKVIWLGSIAILALIALRWYPLLVSTLNEEIAVAKGVKPRVEHLVLNIGLALLVAVSVKIVGALLITAMLIIPAAAARPLARTPGSMAFLAGANGCGAVILGLSASYYLDVPTGPSIIASAAVIFLSCTLLGRLR